MAFSGFFCLLRSQSADVAGSHMAPRCACAGANSWFYDPCWCAFKDGRLWVPAFLTTDVSGRVRFVRTDDFCVVCGSCDLHLVGGVGAERYEKIDRIFIGRPYGIRDNWHLQHE